MVFLGALIVSTPQDVALIDARRGVRMFSKVQVPVSCNFCMYSLIMPAKLVENFVWCLNLVLLWRFFYYDCPQLRWHYVFRLSVKLSLSSGGVNKIYKLLLSSLSYKSACGVEMSLPIVKDFGFMKFFLAWVS